jgi:hypothetical protein
VSSAAYPTRLASLAQEAAFKLKRSAEYLTSASILLAECKRRVDAGDPDAEGASWMDYCLLGFPDYPVSYIDKLIYASSPADPPHEGDSADPQDAFDRAWLAFIALDPKRQHEFVRAYVVRSQGATKDAASGAPADLPNVIDQLA